MTRSKNAEGPTTGQVSLRLHRQVLARADALVSWVAESPVRCPTGEASRSDVLREAVLRGLQSIEDERRKEDRG